MKTIEFNPDGKSTTVPPGPCTWEEYDGKDILREILPVVFHKMKNKLTPVMGYAQILRARTNDDFFKERLDRIERNTTELSDALNTLKDSFKPAPVTKETIDINLILEGLGAQWQEIANSEKITIVLELASGLPAPALNAGQIRLLLVRMVDNAVQALKNRELPGKEIRLTTAAAGSSLKLVIRDNGRGMSEDEMESLWTPFYSKFPDHAGLGLVICERIIANHGAACSVSSVPGEFSRFEIVFPITGDPSQKQNKSGGSDFRS